MATDLTAPSNTLVKVRWHEPYISEGLNKKLNGLVPPGVVRGGVLATNALDMTVTLTADPDTGDSVYSFIDSNGHQLTFRQISDIPIDLTAVASTTVFIGLEVTYVTSADTVVKWRAYSEAEVDADSTIVVLGQVVVPASGVIPAADITSAKRREAWTGTSLQMREWRQVVKDGDFGAFGKSGGSTIAANRYMPFWKTTNINTFDWSVEAIDPYIGDYHLKVEGPSLTGSDYLGSLEVFRCRPGSLLHVFYAVQGIDMVTVGASGEYGIHFFFYDEDRQYIASDVVVTDNTLTGTFGWTEVNEVVEVPATASFFKYAIYINTDGVALGATTVLYFDAVRVFVQADRAIDGHEPGALHDESSQFVALDFPPDIGEFSDLQDRAEKTIRSGQGAIDTTTLPGSDILQLFQGVQASGNDYPFKKVLQEGILKFLNLNGTFSQVVPRMQFETASGGSYSLIWASQETGGSTPGVRIYHGNGLGVYNGFILTVNAYLDSDWARDVAGDSMMLELSQNDLAIRHYDSGGASPWNSNNWDTVSFFNDQPVIPNDKNIEREFVSSSAYQLIWDNVHPTTGPHVRLYVRNYGLYVTSNASYSGGTWSQDWNLDDSVLFEVSSLGVRGYKVQSIVPSWTSWETSGKKMFDFGFTLSSIEGDVDINNGNLDVVDGQVKVDGNPASTVAVDANSLYASNIVKAWCNFSWIGSTPSTNDGFNVTLDSVGNRLVFDFKTDMANDEYSVVFIAVGDEIVSGDYYLLAQGVLSLTGFNLQTMLFDPGGAAGDEFTVVDADTLSGLGCVIVIGEQ